MKINKGFAGIAIILIIIGILAVGGVAYYAGKSSSSAPATTPTSPTVATPSTPSSATTNSNTAVTQSCTLTQSQAENLVLSTWGGCTPDTCGSVTVAVQQNTLGQCVVTAIYRQLRDDSTGSSKKEAIATFSSVWTLGTPIETWACQPNRGHSDYSNVLCI